MCQSLDRMTWTMIVLLSSSCGELPPDPAPLYEARSQGLMNSTSDSGETAVALSYDAALHQSNFSQPNISIRNTGTTRIDGYQYVYEFTASRQPVVDVYWAGGGQFILEHGIDDRYRLRFDCSTCSIGAGATSQTTRFGLHYPNWSYWNKEDDPSFVAAATPTRNDDIAVYDSEGNLIGGRVPEAPAQSSTLAVFARNPSSANLSRPELYVVNAGESSLANFTLRYYLRTENGRTPVLEDWWTPGASSRLTNVAGDVWVVTLDFAGTSLDPGERFPAQGGMQFGLHYRDWSPWLLANDYSDPASPTFVAAPFIAALAPDGSIIGGNDLFPPGRVQSYSAARNNVPPSAYSTTAEEYEQAFPLEPFEFTWDDLSNLNQSIGARYIDVEALLAQTDEGDMSALQPLFDDIPSLTPENFVDKLPLVLEHYESVRRYELVTNVAQLSSELALTRGGRGVAADDDYLGTGLSKDEFWVLASCLGCIDGVRSASERALVSAQERFPGAPLWLDQGDAYRHGIWASLIVASTTDKFSSTGDAVGFARKFVRAHEKGHPSDIYGDTAMDSHNNDESLQYIASVAGTRRVKNFWLIVWIYKTVVTTPSRAEIENAGYQRAVDGLPFDEVDQLSCLDLAWIGTFDRCAGSYELVETAATWPSAKADCEARGAHLVTIGSAAENSYVASLAPSLGHVWIGLSKSAATWSWVDGSGLGFTNWAPGEPNNDGGGEQYAELRPAFGANWNDLPSAWSIPYVCESP